MKATSLSLSIAVASVFYGTAFAETDVEQRPAQMEKRMQELEQRVQVQDSVIED